MQSVFRDGARRGQHGVTVTVELHMYPLLGRAGPGAGAGPGPGPGPDVGPGAGSGSQLVQLAKLLRTGLLSQKP